MGSSPIDRCFDQMMDSTAGPDFEAGLVDLKAPAERRRAGPPPQHAAAHA
jgi:hypothetical protein